MKPWVVIFLMLLTAGVVWGVVNDVFSKEHARLKGTVLSVDFGRAKSKWLPPTSPAFKVRLDDGRIVRVSTKIPSSVPVGGAISVTEWVTPWGQLWYTQRD